MIEAAETAIGFVLGKSRTDLDTDRMQVFALVRAIEIVGQAAGKVSKSTRETAPLIPWAMIVSMRNRLIHAYFDVDREVVWKTAAEELPQILLPLRALVERPEGT
jgi:uncharacterized protein with HEPN domain